MNVTLHITNDCNLKCGYCYVAKYNRQMDRDTAFKAVDFAVNHSFLNERVGISFYGGEPLLCKNLIYDMVIYAKSKYPGKRFNYNLTTNGTLLDDAFCFFAREFGVFYAVSVDGHERMHDMYRVDVSNRGTHGTVMDKMRRLLKTRPSTPVMMTINPDTVPMYYEAVKYLFSEGVRFIFCTLNYAANWTDNDLVMLENEYLKLADMYYEKTMKEDKFYFSPFDIKITTHIFNDKFIKESCSLGIKHISVSASGLLYPCIQFVDDEAYEIGNVTDGIDEEKRNELYKSSRKDMEECTGCAVNHRCNRYCACMNKMATGDINLVAPLQCESERMLIRISDSVAAKLYKKKNALFLQKQYNEMYPVISALEDSKRLMK